MNGVYETLEKLSATSKRNEKIEILKQGMTRDFQWVASAALNPFITYGVKKLPEVIPGVGQFSIETEDMLHSLAHRTLTGNAAKERIEQELAKLCPEHGDILRRILTKDLRAGIDASTINKAKPGLIPEFDCMLSHPYDPERVKAWPVLVEPKLDGVRVLAFVDTVTGKVSFLSRSGKEFTSFEELEGPVLDATTLLRDSYISFGTKLVLDGEVTSGNFLETVGEVRRKSKAAKNAVFNLFDVLPHEMFQRGETYTPMLQRDRTALIQMLAGQFPARVQPVNGVQAASHEEVIDLYNAIRDKGGEGVIVKDLFGMYELKRSYAWMKIKDCQSVDVPIVDVEEGTGKYVGMAGAVVVDVDGVKVSVGSGLSDVQRAEIWELFRNNQKQILGRIAEIEYHEKTAYGSLRHPRFVRFRDALTGNKE